MIRTSHVMSRKEALRLLRRSPGRFVELPRRVGEELARDGFAVSSWSGSSFKATSAAFRP